MATEPEKHDAAGRVAERIVERAGRRIVLGLPLGLGKANAVANALYDLAEADPSIDLSIFTALTLEKPSWSSDIERRFIEPLNERLYADYPGLRYTQAMRAGTLPPNIRVNEFFFQAGQWLGVEAAQRDYVSANYTHAARYILDRGVNVIAQLVAKQGEGADARYSLSSNPDITLDILPELKRRGALIVGEVNDHLPYMPGEAVLPAGDFDLMLEGPSRHSRLFVVPRPPVSDADHAVGLHAAALVKDGGTLQIGIGSLGDALTAGLVLRHREPELFADALRRLSPERNDLGETDPFEAGLYGASEMFVDGFADLYREGILKRPAADGAFLHAGFFVGGRDFYAFLNGLPEEERARFRMRAISFVNELYGDEAQKRADRVHARFVNNAMMVTALGGVVSDALEDGRVVSGVGGQYNFVAQAFALQGARSIVTLNATRMKNARRTSRILWNYGHTTIPRHLRDVVVTEYGVADLRGKSDRDCVVAMLGVTDAAFQDELLDKAKSVGKVERGYVIPRAQRFNTPARIAEALEPLKKHGWCTPFPFGSDFTEEEQRLLPALCHLKGMGGSKAVLLSAAVSGLFQRDADRQEEALLARLDLARPKGLKERFYAGLLLKALRAAAGT